jgi:chitin synthase
MDEDQSARRVAQKYLKVVDADYYEFESKFKTKTKLSNCLTLCIHKYVEPLIRIE